LRQKSERILQAHLQRCSPEEKESLLRFLPESEQLQLLQLPHVQEEGLFKETPFASPLEQVHWSWFLPTLKAFSEREQRLFLSVLSSYAAEQLKTSLSLKGSLEETTEIAKGFLKEQLLYSLDAPQGGLLPREYLPASSLNRLLTLTKKDLIRLIDLLPLYDFAQEIRQIVETKILKKLYSLLSEEQKHILQQITIHKELNPLPKLGIEKWEGTEEALRVLLHRRGLMRLALALAGQDADLIWMVCHQLDIGRGGALFRLCQKSEPHERDGFSQETKHTASDIVQRQIEELLSLL
jgi:hypothetical protein